MPTLNNWRWEKYVPTLGDNRLQEKPFFLRVKAGVSKAQFQTFMDAQGGSAIEAWVAMLGDLVEMGTEPLTVNAGPVDTLEKYIALGLDQPSGEILSELVGAVVWHNTVAGTQASFSARLSGGNPFTVTTAPKTAAPSDGSGTKH